MRELTVRIRFLSHSLGNIKSRNGNFLLPKSASGTVMFLASWHRSNMRFAALTLNVKQSDVDQIHWDVLVDCVVRNKWWRRYSNDSKRYCLHEAIFPQQVVGINCVVPAQISDDSFWGLMQIAGRYKGLSPWRPGEYGFFEVVSIRPRRQFQTEDVNVSDNDIVLHNSKTKSLEISRGDLGEPDDAKT